MTPSEKLEFLHPMHQSAVLPRLDHPLLNKKNSIKLVPGPRCRQRQIRFLYIPSRHVPDPLLRPLLFLLRSIRQGLFCRQPAVAIVQQAGRLLVHSSRRHLRHLLLRKLWLLAHTLGLSKCQRGGRRPRLSLGRAQPRRLPFETGQPT